MNIAVKNEFMKLINVGCRGGPLYQEMSLKKCNSSTGISPIGHCPVIYYVKYFVYLFCTRVFQLVEVEFLFFTLSA